MDNKKIASELVKLAKDIAGSDKPYTFFRVLNATLVETLKDCEVLEWDDALVSDEELGKHFNALKQLLDSAAGRASTIVHRIRKLQS